MVVAAEEQPSLAPMREQTNSEEPAAGTLSQWQLQLHSKRAQERERVCCCMGTHTREDHKTTKGGEGVPMVPGEV